MTVATQNTSARTLRIKVPGSQKQIPPSGATLKIKVPGGVKKIDGIFIKIICNGCGIKLQKTIAKIFDKIVIFPKN